MRAERGLAGARDAGMLGHIRGMEGSFTPVCSVWVASLVGTSILFSQQPDWKKVLFLHWPSVLRKKEYWRAVSTFGAFGGKFDISAMIDIFFLCQSGMAVFVRARACAHAMDACAQQSEQAPARARQPPSSPPGMRIEAMRSWRFCVALVLLASALLYVDYQKFLFTDRTPWLSHRLILSLVCYVHAVCVREGGAGRRGAEENTYPSARLSVRYAQTHTSTRAHTGVPGRVCV